MNIAISMEMTRVLRDTWHAAINHEWYEFLAGHRIQPMCCHGAVDLTDVDLVILAGGNDMHDIRTWRDNHYPSRDKFERELIQQAQQKQLPVVGVCRGAHFLNWIMGGTHRLMADPYDSVRTQLKPFEVVCHHSIEIDQLAPDFKIIEQDARGVIELVINRDCRMMGVGWHPERAVNAHTRSYLLEQIKAL